MAAISRARDLARPSGPGCASSAQKSSISFISSTGSLSLGFAGVQILKFRADLAAWPWPAARPPLPERDADRPGNPWVAQPAGHQKQHVALPPGTGSKKADREPATKGLSRDPVRDLSAKGFGGVVPATTGDRTQQADFVTAAACHQVGCDAIQPMGARWRRRRCRPRRRWKAIRNTSAVRSSAASGPSRRAT